MSAPDLHAEAQAALTEAGSKLSQLSTLNIRKGGDLAPKYDEAVRIILRLIESVDDLDALDGMPSTFGPTPLRVVV